MCTHHVCVFCGSRTGNNPAHIAFARKLGQMLAQQNYGLVFGAGSVGLMNEVANAAIAHGGQTFGVIPKHLNKRERTHSQLSKLHITETMHERKATMANLADAFITLPGGFGTFEELLETITWAQLKIHSKPVIVANVDGYYDPLIKFIDHAVATEFITPANRHLFKTVSTVQQCIQYLPTNGTSA